MTIGKRIKSLRIQKNMTQSDLAGAVEMSYIQIGRYETGKSKPSGNVIQKLASSLNTTADYLLLGNHDDVVAAQLDDKELLGQFLAVEKMNAADKHLVKTFIDAFIVKRKIQQLA